MDDEQHKQLIDLLLTVRGSFAISTYPNDEYDRLLEVGAHKFVRDTACHSAGRTRASGLQGVGAGLLHVPRTEVLYVKGSLQRGFYD